MKFVLKSSSLALMAVAALLVASAVLDSSQAVAATPSVPAQALAGILGSQTLACYAKGWTGVIAVGVANGRIVARAHDDRQARYFAYGAKVNQANIVIALQNSVDGPLATDVLILPIGGLQQLARRQIGSLTATIASREGYDGTSGRAPLTCLLK